MDIKVKSSYLKISPRKIRPILFGIRGKGAEQARVFLTFTCKKGAKMALDLLKSAMAVAKENDLEVDKMLVKTVYCNEGPRLKRRRPKSKGSAYAITKRMSHLTIVLGQSEDIETKETSKKGNVKDKNIKKPEKDNKAIS